MVGTNFLRFVANDSRFKTSGVSPQKSRPHLNEVILHQRFGTFENLQISTARQFPGSEKSAFFA